MPKKTYYIEWIEENNNRLILKRRKIVSPKGYKPLFYKIRDKYIDISIPLHSEREIDKLIQRGIYTNLFKSIKINTKGSIHSARIVTEKGKVVETSRWQIGYNKRLFDLVKKYNIHIRWDPEKGYYYERVKKKQKKK